jgi:hypothetical protein
VRKGEKSITLAVDRLTKVTQPLAGHPRSLLPPFLLAALQQEAAERAEAAAAAEAASPPAPPAFDSADWPSVGGAEQQRQQQLALQQQRVMQAPGTTAQEAAVAAAAVRAHLAPLDVTAADATPTASAASTPAQGHRISDGSSSCSSFMATFGMSLFGGSDPAPTAAAPAGVLGGGGAGTGSASVAASPLLPLGGGEYSPLLGLRSGGLVPDLLGRGGGGGGTPMRLDGGGHGAGSLRPSSLEALLGEDRGGGGWQGRRKCQEGVPGSLTGVA